MLVTFNEQCMRHSSMFQIKADCKTSHLKAQVLETPNSCKLVTICIRRYFSLKRPALPYISLALPEKLTVAQVLVYKLMLKSLLLIHSVINGYGDKLKIHSGTSVSYDKSVKICRVGCR